MRQVMKIIDFAFCVLLVLAGFACLFTRLSFAAGDLIMVSEARTDDDAVLPVEQGTYDEAIGEYERLIAASDNSRDKAFLHKKLGEMYVKKDDMGKAADEFMRALSLYRYFSEEDRVQMAVYISWADRLDEAIGVLRQVLSENPDNNMARTNLARTLSWAGKLDEALSEADSAIRQSPDNKDAILIKANALNWKGRKKEAIPLYESLLSEKESFDARVGLTYSLLAIGNVGDANKSYHLLTPQYPYQKREFGKLTRLINKQARPGFRTGYSYYNDTDDNEYHRYSLDYFFYMNRWKTTVGYRFTDAEDRTRDNDAHEVTINAHAKLSDTVGAGGGIGIVRMKDPDQDNFFTWNVRADKDIMKGRVGVHASRQGLIDTAELIENGITVTTLGASLTRNLTEAFSLYGSYNYKDFSDSNSAHDFQFIPRHRLIRNNPAVTVGYKFRYLDYERQSGNGYFDPDDFYSHQIFASVYYENDKMYMHAEPYAGYQSFERNGEQSEDVIGGATGSLGLKFKGNVIVEFNAEGGSFAVESSSGFRYYLIGARILFPYP